MVKNRLNRVQFQCNDLEENNHFKFNNDLVEEKCREEMAKLLCLLRGIVGKDEDKYLNDDQKRMKAQALKPRRLNSKGEEIDDDQLSGDENLTDEERANRRRKSNLDNMNKGFDANKAKENTEFKEFQIGKREKKMKGEHKVIQFITKFILTINDPNSKLKANVPPRKILSTISSLYDDYNSADINLRFSLTE